MQKETEKMDTPGSILNKKTAKLLADQDNARFWRQITHDWHVEQDRIHGLAMANKFQADEEVRELGKAAQAEMHSRNLSRQLRYL